MAPRGIAFGLGLLIALGAPAGAAAHASFERSAPANGAVLAQSPAVVRLVFDGDVEPLEGAAAIRNGGGSVLAGRSRHEAGSRRVLLVPLRRSLGSGDYTVRWRALSDDGHVLQGVLAFAVGIDRAPPVPVLAATDSRPSTRNVVSRWLLFAGLLAAAGTALFALAARRALRPGGDVAEVRASAIVSVGCAVFVVGATLVGNHSSWDTRFGAAINLGIAAGLVASTLAAIAVFARRARLPAWLLALALVPVPSFAGHAFEAGRPWPNVVADILHLLAASAWVGALLALLLVIPAAARAAGTQRGQVWSGAAIRASTLALGAGAILAATGVIRAGWELTSPSELVSTGYGRSLLVKTGLLLALIGIGWSNRAALTPLLAGEGGLVARLRRNVRAELALLAILVGAVAVLTELRPGRDGDAIAAPTALVSRPAPPPPEGALVLASQAGTLAVGLAVEPGRLTATVLRPDGTGAAGLEVTIAGRPAQPCGAGCYRADRAGEAGRVVVGIAGRSVLFDVPLRAPRADAVVRQASIAFRRLRSVVYRESLGSGRGRSLETLWQIRAPDRLRYDIAGRGSAVVIGGRRWDRSGSGPWRVSAASPLAVPAPLWTSAARVRNARLLSRADGSLRLSFVDPSLPAWFDVALDSRTLLPRTIRMTAPSHFMRQRYLSYNRPVAILPPGRN